MRYCTTWGEIKVSRPETQDLKEIKLWIQKEKREGLRMHRYYSFTMLKGRTYHGRRSWQGRSISDPNKNEELWLYDTQTKKLSKNKNQVYKLFEKM